jgi:hypothetical protein
MNSILSDISWQFQKPDGDIYDNTQAKVLEFYPAGYTQKFMTPAKIKGVVTQINRQEYFKMLWEEAETLESTEKLFPFSDSKFKYKINFVPEPWNRFDSFAIRIEICISANNSEPISYNIGYVPAKINKKILANKEMISDKQILSVTETLKDKFYCARIAVAYDNTVLNKNKFMNICG